jgi:hypothetical protein
VPLRLNGTRLAATAEAVAAIDGGDDSSVVLPAEGKGGCCATITADGCGGVIVSVSMPMPMEVVGGGREEEEKEEEEEEEEEWEITGRVVVVLEETAAISVGLPGSTVVCGTRAQRSSMLT